MNLAIKNDLSFAGRMRTSHDLDYGTFATSVFTKQVIDLTSLKRHVHPSEGMHTAKPFVDVSQLKEAAILRILLGHQLFPFC